MRAVSQTLLTSSDKCKHFYCIYVRQNRQDNVHLFMCNIATIMVYVKTTKLICLYASSVVCMIEWLLVLLIDYLYYWVINCIFEWLCALLSDYLYYWSTLCPFCKSINLQLVLVSFISHDSVQVSLFQTSL